MCFEVVVAALRADNQYEDFAPATAAAVVTLSKLMMKHSGFTTDSLLEEWLRWLPVKKARNASVAYRLFLEILVSRTPLLLSAENRSVTLRIVAKLCQRGLLDAEANTQLREFLLSWGHDPTLASILSEGITELKPRLQGALCHFLHGEQEEE
jgi:hypothetical protein